MNNLYDIISHQKILVDVNINKYEINGLIESLSYINYDYLSEGFSDIVNKVIEFIKAMINKLRELFTKVINFFRGTAEKKGNIVDTVKSKVENQNIEITKELIIKVVKSSQKVVNTIKYAALPVKENVAKVFLEAVYTVSELYFSDKQDVNDRFETTILRAAFKGEGKFSKNKEIDIIGRTKLEIGEPTEAQNYKVADIADEIISYTVDIKDITNTIRELHGRCEKSLKNLINKVENAKPDDKDSVARANAVVTMVGQFTNYICTSIVTSFNHYEKIAVDAVMDYINNGSKNNKANENKANENQTKANENKANENQTKANETKLMRI